MKSEGKDYKLPACSLAHTDCCQVAYKHANKDYTFADSESWTFVSNVRSKQAGSTDKWQVPDQLPLSKPSSSFNSLVFETIRGMRTIGYGTSK